MLHTVYNIQYITYSLLTYKRRKSMEDMAAVKNQMLYQKHCRASANNKRSYPFYIWKYYSFKWTQSGSKGLSSIKLNHRRTLAFTSGVFIMFSYYVQWLMRSNGFVSIPSIMEWPSLRILHSRQGMKKSFQIIAIIYSISIEL